MEEKLFRLRKDQNGLRPVFLLGNELGACPVSCTFCNVGKSTRVTSEDNIRKFDEQYDKYLKVIDGLYHPVIYNRGNVTDSEEFSSKTLNHILDRFSGDERVKFVSINSRERFATPSFLEYCVAKRLNYPIHFILGIESFSKNAKQILGKDTAGELQHFVDKLKPYNQSHKQTEPPYLFGLDANLLFLPELYLGDGEGREGNYAKIRRGLKTDLRQLLDNVHSDVPVEINIHPFCHVDNFPYRDADIDMLIGMLPDLQSMVHDHNKIAGNYQTHLFVGTEGIGYTAGCQKARTAIDCFNQTDR